MLRCFLDETIIEPYIVLDTYVFCDDCWHALILDITLLFNFPFSLY